MALKILLSTGEVSGDLISSHLVRALLAQRSDLEIIAVGGPKVEQAGAQLIFNSYHMGAMGLIELLPVVISVLRLRRKVMQAIQQHKPDLAILVDCNGFNSGLAAKLKKKGVPSVCFIPPQDWVFGKVNTLMRTFIRCCERVICIFPEEHEFYASLGARSICLGHPLMDIVKNISQQAQSRQQLGLPLKGRVVSLLPISRRQEIRYILPEILQTIKLLHQYDDTMHFCLPVVRLDLYQEIEKVCQQAGCNNLLLCQKQSQLAIAAADVVISKSGTVNLETAIIGVPQVVFYKLNALTFWFAKNIMRMPNPQFISPVNLLAMQSVVPEFLQQQATPKALADAVMHILNDRTARQRFDQGYDIVRAQMGQAGVLNRVAKTILGLVKTTNHVTDEKEVVL